MKQSVQHLSHEEYIEILNSLPNDTAKRTFAAGWWTRIEAASMGWKEDKTLPQFFCTLKETDDASKERKDTDGL